LNNIGGNDRELDALERIQQSRQPVRQRDLARIIGLSLGLTNAILKRLAQKGLLQVQKINNRNIQYVVSAKGMEEIALRSYRYLKRTIKNVVYYKEAIQQLVQGVEAQGFQRIVLLGDSDLDFIVEHLCHKHNLTFARASTTGVPVGPAAVKDFLVYAENARQPVARTRNSASLRFLFQSQSSASLAARTWRQEEGGI
jgi:DNA-binding MarR family transcriptional regulator